MDSDLRAGAPRCLSRENAGRAKVVLHHALCGDCFYPTLVSITFRGKCSNTYNFYFVGDATQVDNNSDDFKVTAQKLPE